MHEQQSYVYILTNKKRGVLYIGVTNDLMKRVWEHRSESKGFTGKYFLKHLVYYETFGEVSYAIGREKQLKNWHRDWKISLIEKMNPNWEDLYLKMIAD